MAKKHLGQIINEVTAHKDTDRFYVLDETESLISRQDKYTTFAQLKSDIQTAVGQLSAADIKTLYESNEDTNAFTDALLTKLQNISDRFKGRYTTAADLSTAHPTATSGDYAYVADADPSIWIWDAGTSAWADTGASSTGDMLASIYDPTGIGLDAFNRVNHYGDVPKANVTGLTTDLTNLQTAINNNTASITTLDTRLTTAETGISSNNTYITNVDNRLQTVEGTMVKSVSVNGGAANQPDNNGNVNLTVDTSGTGGATVDAALSDTSTNPVQNKVVKVALDDKAPLTHNHSKLVNGSANFNAPSKSAGEYDLVAKKDVLPIVYGHAASMGQLPAGPNAKTLNEILETVVLYIPNRTANTPVTDSPGILFSYDTGYGTKIHTFYAFLHTGTGGVKVYNRIRPDGSTTWSAWEPQGGAGDAVSTFLDLTDVDPTTYTGHGNKPVKVNAGGTKLEFGKIRQEGYSTLSPAATVGWSPQNLIEAKAKLTIPNAWTGTNISFSLSDMETGLIATLRIYNNDTIAHSVNLPTTYLFPDGNDLIKSTIEIPGSKVLELNFAYDGDKVAVTGGLFA